MILVLTEFNLIVYKNITISIRMSIIALTERYTPPEISLSLWLIERTSLRKSFLSADLRFDLSIILISFNLSVNILASAVSAGVGAGMEVAGVIVAALDWSGRSVSDKHVAIRQIAIFFILVVLNISNTKDMAVGQRISYTILSISYIIHIFLWMMIPFLVIT